MSTATMIARSEDYVPVNEAVRGPIGDEQAAAGIGLFSIALGAAEVLAPETLSRMIGIESNPTLLRFLGAREIASGIGIMSNSRPTGWLWGRVAGNVMDLAVLGAAPLRSQRSARGKLAAATAAVIGVTLADVVLAMRYAGK